MMMGWDFCKTTEQKARKDYNCDAADWLINTGIDEADFSHDENLIIKKAQSEKWKILKGTNYVKCKGKYEGEFSEFKARKDLDDICKKHGVYQE
jgi:hypothetical protein